MRCIPTTETRLALRSAAVSVALRSIGVSLLSSGVGLVLSHNRFSSTTLRNLCRREVITGYDCEMNSGVHRLILD